jgi:hypothetical protein
MDEGADATACLGTFATTGGADEFFSRSVWVVPPDVDDVPLAFFEPEPLHAEPATTTAKAEAPSRRDRRAHRMG